MIQNEKNCEHVVKLLDHELISRSLMVLVMELGQETLADIIRKEELSLSEIRRTWSSVLACVEDLHSHNIIHCDIKPENFILVNGQMKIIDFGLSLVLPEQSESVDLDQTYGTGVYLAPECLDSNLCKKDGANRFVTTIRYPDVCDYRRYSWTL